MEAGIPHGTGVGERRMSTPNNVRKEYKRWQ